MCIKILTQHDELPYDMNKPLEDQIVGAEQIVVDFQPDDPSVDKFLGEIERFARCGFDYKFNIRVNHFNYLNGSKLKKQIKKVENDLTVNELIKLMARSYDSTDRALEELSNFCTSTNGKQKA